MTNVPADLFPAILFQAQPAPSVNGISKLMKESGYADSGADIAFALDQCGIKVVTPVSEPRIEIDREWVFPDTPAGISHAINKGANVLWLNTVLYADHPVREFLRKGGAVVGQDPALAELYDDKWVTSDLLLNAHLPVPSKKLVTAELTDDLPFDYPFVIKPIRGRGSQGVHLIETKDQYRLVMARLINEGLYGNTLYAEPYLPGEEITVTVMPPGRYEIFGEKELKSAHWCLTAVKRFSHKGGIAPYSGLIPVVENSRVVSAKEHNSDAVQLIYEQCSRAAGLVRAKAPVRIDCRQDEQGRYLLFDVNLKPNMTVPSRQHRFGQDSLVALAAADIGWNYTDLLINILNQHWRQGV